MTKPAQSHTVLSTFPNGEASQVSYALRGATEAIVFVHGYRGSSLTTWTDFPHLINQITLLENLDCFFWGYDSVREHTESCADRFYKLLRALMTKPASARRPASIPGKNSSPYRRILVVAHSMGAVVSRRALLIADASGAPWTKQVRLMLYAPAHHGARLELVDGFLPGLLGTIWKFAQYRSPAINQLRPKSDYLKDFTNDVETALKASPKPRHLIALRVVHARQETVLHRPEKQFGDDPIAEFIDGTHKSICKPKAIQSPELHELTEAIKEWL